MEISFENGSYIKKIESKEGKRPQMIEYIYELPEPTDEEIQKEIDAEGFTNVIMPEDVRRYIRESIYKLYCKTMIKNEVIEKWE